jgi:flagellar biosynthesis/type III secretory pathway protein FliH
MNKEEAYDAGYETGYDAGREESTTEYYDTGYSDGHEEGYSEGYEEGYSEGLDEGKEYVDETAFEEFQSDIIALEQNINLVLTHPETESFEQQLMETQQVLQKCLHDMEVFV